MPITFDTLEELQEFYKSFKLDENARTALKKAKAKVGRPKTAKSAAAKPAKKAAASKSKPAAKKSAAKAVKPVAKKAAKPAAKKSAAKPAAKKAGVKPAAKKPAAKKTTKPALKKAPPKAAAKKPAAPKNNGATLTGKIRGTIQSFLDNKKSFTANDIYADLSQRDKTVNKQSVITSVLKQMNSTFKTIPVTERPGNGPRPVKLYNP